MPSEHVLLYCLLLGLNTKGRSLPATAGSTLLLCLIKGFAKSHMLRIFHQLQTDSLLDHAAVLTA